MANYFTATDIAHLNEYATFASGLPASLTQFKKTINLGLLQNWFQSELFEVSALTSQSEMHAEAWRAYPATHKMLHRDFQQFTAEFVRHSEQLLNTQSASDSSGLIRFASTGTDKYLRAFNHHEETMIRLATCIYTVLPRLTDYLYSNLYAFAGWQNTLANINYDKGNAYYNSVLLIFLPADPKGARRREALNLIDRYQRTYALSYVAASNLIGHFTRVKEMMTACLQRAVELRHIKDRSHLNFNVRLLLTSLNEIQRLSAAADDLFRARA